MTRPKARILNPAAQQWCVRSAVPDVIFWDRTAVEGDCLVYTGHRDRQGYGKVGRKGMNPTLAHRYAWSLVHGPVPPFQVVMHTCDNPPCVNVDHLRLGTQADNIADRGAKGRTRTGRMLGEDHPGHKLSAEDVLEMRRDWRSGTSIVELASWYEIGYGTAWQILHGKLWAHLPLDGKAA